MRPHPPGWLLSIALGNLLAILLMAVAPVHASAPFQGPEVPQGTPQLEGRITARPAPDGALQVAVVEHLRVKVPSQARQAWLQAERDSWEPWLRRQEGFLGRDLFWDAEREEGILLIRWASREQWHAIPEAEVSRVQRLFERLARQALGSRSPNPFPLTYSGELDPAADR